MGCVPISPKISRSKTKRLTIFKYIHFKTKKSSHAIPVVARISDSSWMHIADFLKYKELKELGKTNRYFNNMSKNCTILVKFFKKQKYQFTSKSIIIYQKDISEFDTNIKIKNTAVSATSNALQY